MKNYGQNDGVRFEDLRQIMNIEDSISFGLYLGNIFKELSNKKVTSKGNDGISKKSFYNFIKLPIFIAEKVFDMLVREKEDQEAIQFQEFSKFLHTLYLGSYRETAELIFKLYDFNNDGIIEKKDVKHILSFLPLRENHKENENEQEIKTYIYQIDSLMKLSNYLKEPFQNEEIMNFDKFFDSIEDGGEIFLQLLCFIYISLPITSDSLWIYDKISTSKNSSVNNTPLLLTISPRISINSRTNFSPLGDFLKLNNTPVTRMKMKLNKLKNHASAPQINSESFFSRFGKKPSQSVKNLDLLQRFTKSDLNVFQSKNIVKGSFLKSESSTAENLTKLPLREESEEKKKSKNEEDIPDNILQENVPITPFDQSIYEKIPLQKSNKSTIFEVENEAEEDEVLSRCKSRKTNSNFNDEIMELENDKFVNTNYNDNGIIIENKLKSRDNSGSSINICLKEFLVALSLNDEEDPHTNEEQIKKLLKEEEIKREKRIVLYESELLKFIFEKKTFKIFYIKLIHQNIYYYKTQNEPEENFYKMHYLSDCFVSKLESKVL